MSRVSELIAVAYAVRHFNRHACQDRAARTRDRRAWRRSCKNPKRATGRK